MLVEPKKEEETRKQSRLSLPPAYEGVRQTLLLTGVVLPPWLFGTADDWAVKAMNGVSYAAGVLLLIRFFFLRRPSLKMNRADGARWLTMTLAGLTLFVLLFCAVGALNARATFLLKEGRFDYHPSVAWLPFSYDKSRTWFVFWTYLGLAGFFWCLRDWILCDPGLDESARPWDLPPRIRALLWTISINTAALALVGLFEKLTGTNQLLWFRDGWDRTPGALFATYSFSGNAAQYFNLAWPAMLATWWTFRQRAANTPREGIKIGGKPHLLLLPCTVLAAAAPIISSSEGGALITLLCLLFVCVILFSKPALNWRGKFSILFLASSILLFGGYLSSDTLLPFLRQASITHYSNPSEIYENAEQMAADYPVFGIGPGAFRALYQLYRKDPSQGWQAYLHDDWLETRVTFGWVGSAVILGMLALVLARWFVPRGIPSTYEFAGLIWVALAGCLIHAKFSFPLQIYSILQLFLVLCCILLCISRPVPKWAG